MRRLLPLTEEIREEVSPVILDDPHAVGSSSMFSTSHLPASTAPNGLPSDVATSVYDASSSGSPSLQRWLDVTDEIMEVYERCLLMQSERDYRKGI
jgi:hypothetical protein